VETCTEVIAVFLFRPKPLSLHPSAEAVCSRLHSLGFKAYVVGGAVRDSLRGLHPDDWDITTDAPPEEVEQAFTDTYPTGKEFGTISVKKGGMLLEVTTMRRDSDYSDMRRPDQVSYTRCIEEDLKRRDFTVNAIAYDPACGRFIDPYAGIKDIRRRCLRTVGDPSDRFAEDPLRMLRLLRFMATLQYRPSRKTWTAVEPSLIDTVSRERIADELSKLLTAAKPAKALEGMYDLGIMDRILPELAAGAGIAQGDRHHWDVLGHSIRATEAVKPELTLRLAALLHDIGKPPTYEEASDRIRFSQHEQVGSEMARRRLLKLRFRRSTADYVAHLIRWHMFPIHPRSTDKALRRFAAKVGLDAVWDLLELRRADIMAMRFQPRQALEYGRTLARRLEEVLSQSNVYSTHDLAVGGEDIMQVLGIEPGPEVGRVLNYLLDQVLADPDKNQRDVLLALAREYYHGRKSS